MNGKCTDRTTKGETMKNGNGLKIEKGIPVPATQSAWGRLSGTLKKLQPTESVEVDMAYNSAYQAATRYLGHGNFIIRPTDGKRTSDCKKVRIWRTA